MEDYTKYMLEALKEAELARKEDEVPVGCVIVKNDIIIARAHNQRETPNNPLGHAEALAIKKASEILNNVLAQFKALKSKTLCTYFFNSFKVSSRILSLILSASSLLDSSSSIDSTVSSIRKYVYVFEPFMVGCISSPSASYFT